MLLFRKYNSLHFSFSLFRTTELPDDSGWETILGNEESQQQEVKKDIFVNMRWWLKIFNLHT